ncbi:MAG: DDE-type integrase/transposase/recombinase [Pseudonocardiaceae bacterium]
MAVHGHTQRLGGVRRTSAKLGSSVKLLASEGREKRYLAATRRFFTRALERGSQPAEVSTNHASAYPRVLDELLPTA